MNIALEQTEVSAPRQLLSGVEPLALPVAFDRGTACAGCRSCLATHPAPQEYVNGQLKSKYGDAFIRGNNGERLWVLQGGSSPVPA